MIESFLQSVKHYTDWSVILKVLLCACFILPSNSVDMIKYDNAEQQIFTFTKKKQGPFLCSYLAVPQWSYTILTWRLSEIFLGWCTRCAGNVSFHLMLTFESTSVFFQLKSKMKNLLKWSYRLRQDPISFVWFLRNTKPVILDIHVLCHRW